MDKTKIDILKNEIDADSIITSLYSSSTYTDLFLKLLRNPSSSTLSKLVINYFSKMTTDIKYLIKFKYRKLNSAIQDNLNTIVVLLLDYNTNIDTLIINLLRHGVINIPIDHYYFKENQSALGFIMYHKSDRSDLSSPNYIASTISFDMESGIHFINEVRDNIKFYVKTFVNKYKRNAADILRFIKISGCLSKNMDFLVKNLNEVVNNNSKDKNRKAELTRKEEPLKNLDPFGVSKKVEEYIKEVHPDSILLSIGEFNFPKYFNVIQDMKSSKKLFIDPRLYREIVLSKEGYDIYLNIH
ncbi:hypothetical protein P3W45_000592 [Vairimorpha bombi]